jgi:hypothetical protein
MTAQHAAGGGVLGSGGDHSESPGDVTTDLQAMSYFVRPFNNILGKRLVVAIFVNTPPKTDPSLRSG